MMCLEKMYFAQNKFVPVTLSYRHYQMASLFLKVNKIKNAVCYRETEKCNVFCL